MLAFEVHVNGKRACVAGIGEPGVLTATLTWVLGEPRGQRVGREDMGVQVGGLISRGNEFVEWYRRAVRRGDEVVIRIVDVAESDTPRRRRRESPAQRRRHQQAYVRRMAKEFGWKIVTRRGHGLTRRASPRRETATVSIECPWPGVAAIGVSRADV